MKNCGATLLIFGLIGVIGGAIILILLPRLVRERVESDVALKEGSLTEKTWSAPPFKIVMQFWIFNVTNADDVLNRGAKPVLEQKGPYGFRETQIKERISFSSQNNTVSYANRKEYFFDSNSSCPTCLESDKFTVPNIPYLTAMKLIRDKAILAIFAHFFKNLLHQIGEHPFVSDISAKQLLFEGYHDNIFSLINLFKKGAVPERMGLFYGKNSSNDGLYEIRTGVDDPYSVGRIVSWENRADLYWTGWWRNNFRDANLINGTDGTVYPPFISRESVLPMFARDICRSLYVTYESDVTAFGMIAYRFSAPPDVFLANVSANRGFCWPSRELYYSESVQPRDSGGWCLPSGMLDVSKCQNGAPIVVTSPQFLSCPDEVRESVVGLSPPSEEFKTFIDIEPTTGVVLSGARKVQLNVAMYFDHTSRQISPNAHSVIVPIVWLNESVEIDQQTRDYLYKNVVVSQRTAHIGAYTAIGVGSSFLLVLFAFIAYRVVKSRNDGECCPGLKGRKTYVDDQSDILPESSVASEA